MDSVLLLAFFFSFVRHLAKREFNSRARCNEQKKNAKLSITQAHRRTHSQKERERERKTQHMYSKQNSILQAIRYFNTSTIRIKTSTCERRAFAMSSCVCVCVSFFFFYWRWTKENANHLCLNWMASCLHRICEYVIVDRQRMTWVIEEYDVQANAFMSKPRTLCIWWSRNNLKINAAFSILFFSLFSLV